MNEGLDSTIRNRNDSDYAILEVKPKGISGNEVLVRYFNKKTNEYLEKIDNVLFYVPSREFIQGKHGHLEQVLSELRIKHPNIEFSYSEYNKDSYYEHMKYEKFESEINYKDSKEDIETILLDNDKEDMFFRSISEEPLEQEIVTGKSYIIKATMNDRSQRKKLDYMIGKKKDKQLFITNIDKHNLARTKLYSYEEIEMVYEEVLNDIQNTEITPEDIFIKKSKKETDKYFIQVRCNQNQLKLLDADNFRILRYESEKFERKNDANKIFEKIQEIEGFNTNIEKYTLVETTDKFYKKKYHIILSVANDSNTINELEKLGINAKTNELNHQEYITLKDDMDPFMLNSPRKQLLNLFPVFMDYNPDKPLQEQTNFMVRPFEYYPDEKNSKLEKKLNEAINFFKKNTCSIDLEVTKWLENVIPSGRVYAAILDSGIENKLYVTKDLWKNNEWKNKLSIDMKKRWGDSIEVILLEDEIELIAKLYVDSKKYIGIMGHNLNKYDFTHLVKFNKKVLTKKKKIELTNKIEELNQELVNSYKKTKYVLPSEKAQQTNKTNKLVTEIKKLTNTLKVSDRIEEVKEKYGIPKNYRLWHRRVQDNLDTMIYTKYTLSLLPNKKLSTIAGFTKQENYKDLEDKMWSDSYEDKLDVCNYTVVDGSETTIANNKIMTNAILTALLSNKPLSAVFANNPLELFYTAGDREYELRTGTYSKRHERSYSRFKEKLNNRKPLKELLIQHLKDIPQTKGVFSGKLYYPSVIFEVFSDIITKNPVARFMFDRMKQEENLLSKADLLAKLENYLRIPVDKASVYMQNVNLEFGNSYSPSKIYDFISESNPDVANIVYHYKKPKYVKKDDVAQIDLWDERKPSEIKNEVIKNQEYFLSNAQFSQACKIFSIEYGAKAISIGSGLGTGASFSVPFKSGVMHETLKLLKRQKIDAYTDEYVVSKENLGYAGYYMGDISLINLTSKGKPAIIGKMTKDDRTYEIYQKVSKPRNKHFVDLIDSVLNGKKYSFEEFMTEYDKIKNKLKLNALREKKEKNLHKRIIEGLFGVDLDNPQSFKLTSKVED